MDWKDCSMISYGIFYSASSLTEFFGMGEMIILP